MIKVADHTVMNSGGQVSSSVIVCRSNIACLRTHMWGALLVLSSVSRRIDLSWLFKSTDCRFTFLQTFFLIPYLYTFAIVNRLSLFIYLSILFIYYQFTVKEGVAQRLEAV